MSLATLTSLAAVRDHAAPTKGHVGKQSPRKGDRATPASLGNLLVSSVPTELVAPYTAVTAVIVGSIAKPARRGAPVDHYEKWRWIAFAILLLGTAGTVWVGALRKGLIKRRIPLIEIAAAVTAAAGWALALPNSPLALHLDKGERAFVPAIVAFGAIALTGVFASGMQGEARPRRRGRRRAPTGDAPATQEA